MVGHFYGVDMSIKRVTLTPKPVATQTKTLDQSVLNELQEAKTVKELRSILVEIVKFLGGE